MKFSSEFEPRDFAIAYDTRLNTANELVSLWLINLHTFLDTVVVREVAQCFFILCFCKPRNALHVTLQRSDGTILESFAH